MVISRNLNLKPFNSYRIDSIARIAYFPESEEDVISAVRECNGQAIVLGSGFNVIFSQQFYDSPFIIFDSHFSAVNVHGTSISAQSGCSMQALSKIALENSLQGLEIFYDIPSSLGGAIVMNAGASGEEIKDILSSVTFLDVKEMMVKSLGREALGFSYRNSFFQEQKGNAIVLEASLNLTAGNRSIIQEKMDRIAEDRRAKQPKDLPNAGSVFKRPVGKFVGPMIEELGLKGYSIGGAKVSEKHAGFIVNTGNASGQDVVALINFVREQVYLKFNVLLEVEQRII